eukprot:GHVN01080745.1.p1 GENE.GHVN01080745.1~~GHVN01080745.1.p1  ORF type:complete len:681 (+),score=110.51 GHVN01080745.1:40-2043(+)
MTDTVEVMTQPNPDVRPTTNDASHSSSSYKALHPASTDNSMPRRHSTKRLDIDEVKAMLLAREKSEKESDVRRAVSEISSCSPATIKFTDLILDVQVQDVAQQKGPAIIRRIKTGVCGGTTTTRRILHGINGVIEPGDCVALMGASGAGKTTLLNVLAGRIGGWSGLVKVNNKVLKRDAFNAVSCFIQQEDLFNGYLTVGEQLNFMARMRVKDDAVRAERLKRLIKGLNLTHRLNARIGNMQQQAKSEISGGEKKRVSIATQLLTNPSIIFADEPTSGLDSPIAVSVCEILNFLAYSGRTVITTIHQPSTAVFEMFNKVLLLSEGRMIYFGDRLGAVAWFSRLGGSYTVPTHSNPADHLIEALAIKPDEKATKLIEIQGLAEKWMNERVIFLEEWEREGKIEFVSEALNETGGVGATIARSASYIGGSVAPTRDASGDKDLVIIPEPPVSWCVQLGYLFYRCMRVHTAPQLTIQLRSSLIYRDMSSFQYGSSRQSQINMTFSHPPGLPGSPHSTPSPNSLSSNLTHSLQLPQLTQPFTFLSIFWFLVGLNDSAAAFFSAMGFIVLFVICFVPWGYFLSVLAPNLAAGITLSTLVILPFILCSGFVVNLGSLSDFWIWLVYLSPMRWSLDGVCHIVFAGVIYNVPDCNNQPALMCTGDDVSKVKCCGY